jgi:hypothetical protein
MNKATILKKIEIGINNLKQEEALHFSHVASTLVNTYTSKNQKAIVFFFDTELDEVELIPINADENETNKLLSFIVNLQGIDRPYDS